MTRRFMTRGVLPALFTALILGILIAIVIRRFDAAGIVHLWLTADPGWLAVAGGMMLIITVVSAARVQHIIATSFPGVDPTLASLIRVQFISQFIAHGMPVGGLADLARIAVIKLRYNMTVGGATQVVLCERVLGMLGMIATGILASVAQIGMDVHGQVVMVQIVVWCSGVAGLIVLVAMSDLKIKIPWRFVATLARVLQHLGSLMKFPSFVVVQFCLAVLYSLSFSGVLWALAVAMNIPIHPLLLITFAPIILLISSLPIFFLGWGGREAIIVATLGVIGGIGEQQALSLSIAYGAVVMICALPGGVLWLMRPGLRKAIRAEVAAEETSAQAASTADA